MFTIGIKIKTLRERQGKSIRSLASACGLSPGLISQVELGQTSPSLATLIKIAEQLQCPVGSFFDSPLEEEIVKRNKRRKLQFPDRNLTYELATPSSLDGKVRLLKMTLAPGQVSSSDHISHRDQEVLYVEKGSVSLEFEGKTHQLEEGDSITFDAMKPHRYHNQTEMDAEIMLVIFQ